MSWLEQLQAASINDVVFQVDTMSFTGGTDGVLHEYPFRDLPTWQPIGKTTKEITVNAYVIGDDYLEQLALLTKELETTGIKKLNHPTQGIMEVEVKGKFEVKENIINEGGMARVDITFVRTSNINYPIITANTQSELETAAQETINTSKEDFADKFSAANVPQWVISSSEKTLGKAAEIIEQNLAKYRQVKTSTRGNIFKAINSPVRLADSLEDLINIKTIVKDDLNAVLTDIKLLFNPQLQDNDLSPYNTASQRQAVKNLQAVNNLVSIVTLSEMSLLVASTEFRNKQQAIALQANLDSLFKAAISKQTEYTLLQALNNLHVKVITDIKARSIDAAFLTNYSSADGEPLIYTSYKLYGDSDYVEEIMSNNLHVLHPLLVPTSQPLQVVAREEE